MKFQTSILCCFCLVVFGCAANPESIQPAYVSTLTYVNFTCQQLGEEEARVNAAYVMAAGQQVNARTLDTVGDVLLALPIGSMTGENVAPQVANLKGEQDAIHQVEIQKNCAPAAVPQIAAAAQANKPAAVIAPPPPETFADGTAAYKRGDYKSAVEVWQSLAIQGDSEAQRSLGLMYLHGSGVSQDNNEAVKWITKSASQGNVRACDNLGWMYENGNTVKQDRVQAYVWYSRAVAASKGDNSKLPKSNFARVSATLSPEEISQANVAVGEVTP